MSAKAIINYRVHGQIGGMQGKSQRRTRGRGGVGRGLAV